MDETDEFLFFFFNFHPPLGNNVCGQKRSSQYCCGSVCLAKTHYTGYYYGRSPGRGVRKGREGGAGQSGVGRWGSLMKILMTPKLKIYKKPKLCLSQVWEEDEASSCEALWRSTEVFEHNTKLIFCCSTEHNAKFSLVWKKIKVGTIHSEQPISWWTDMSRCCTQTHQEQIAIKVKF